MRGTFHLIASVFEALMGLLAILSYVILRISGENMRKWHITVLFATALVIIGVRGILSHCKRKQDS